MNDSRSTGVYALPLALARQVDQVCDRFEEAWLSGRRPRIEEFLGEAPQAARPTLLRELLRLELERRCRAGERPAADEYHARFPDLVAQVDALLGELTLHVSRAPASNVVGPGGGTVRFQYVYSPRRYRAGPLSRW